MKHLNRLLFLSMVMTCLSPLSQTKEIAWKSHSGRAGKFNPNGQGDLGVMEPQAVLIKVEKVNDSTFVKTFKEPNGKTYSEKSVNEQIWMQPKVALESFVLLYYPSLEMIGFEGNTEPVILSKTKKEKRTSRKKK